MRRPLRAEGFSKQIEQGVQAVAAPKQASAMSEFTVEDSLDVDDIRKT